MQSRRLVLRPPAVVPGIASSPSGRSTLGNPGGHVAGEDRSVVKVSADVTRKGQTGSFGCPRARSEAEFPPAR
jgi:hypothetical protein